MSTFVATEVKFVLGAFALGLAVGVFIKAIIALLVVALVAVGLVSLAGRSG